MNLILRWIILTLALVIAVWAVPGIRIEGIRAWLTLLVMAVIFGLVNALIRPILDRVSNRLNMALLGILTLVVNAIGLWLASLIATRLGVGFYIDGFLPALIGSVIISIVSFALSLLLLDK